jgi:AmmeMemoRadiSam system protein A
MQNILLTPKESLALVKLARKVLMSLNESSEPEIPSVYKEGNLSKFLGVFVTLYFKGKLRGCIGSFTASSPLYQNVVSMTRQAALNDYRFDPVKSEELDDIEIEISVLSPLEKISSIDEIELGKHGIYIKKDFRSGTYLPQVALKTGWNTEEFVSHCSNEKAGLGWNGWRGAELFRYETLIIKE